ncbi:MAG: hypothetical protein ABJL71_16295 [Cyclobacteriaceae bacterium]|uniref:hypothetical protein n=1 Tax=Reichenbachiella sp. TaxID=2184521 RepID=UPI0032654D74
MTSEIKKPRQDVVLYSKKARSYRAGKWKIVDYNYCFKNPQDLIELFNLEDEPNEKDNLADRYPEVLEMRVND